MKLFNEGRLRVCGALTGTCNLSSLEVEAERGHEFEANVDNMAHLGFTINPVSRKNSTPKPSKQNNSNNKTNEYKERKKKKRKRISVTIAVHLSRLICSRGLSLCPSYNTSAS